MPTPSAAAAGLRSTRPHSPGSRARWFGAFLVVWAMSAAVCLRLVTTPGYEGDVAHYKYWTRVVATQGIQSIYAGVYPETYAIYPPVTLYVYGVIGKVYEQGAFNPWNTERMLASAGFSTLIKGVAVGFLLLLGIVLFALLTALHGPKWGTLGSAAFLLNPAVIFDSAYWGQPDSAHSMWGVLAFGLLALGRWQGSWIAAGLGAMTKPQLWALMPLFLLVQTRDRSRPRLAAGMLLALVTVTVVVSPFAVHGRLADFLTLPSQIAGVMPVASANAHNLWWIVSGNPGGFHLDSETVLGPLTYRQVALPLVLAVAVYTLWLAWRRPTISVFLLAAYQAFGWFMFTTQAHENHPFMVLPLLVMAAPLASIARVLFAIVSVTLLANMALHDPFIIDRTSELVSESIRFRLQILNSWINLATFAVWTWALAARGNWVGWLDDLPDRNNEPGVI